MNIITLAEIKRTVEEKISPYVSTIKVRCSGLEGESKKTQSIMWMDWEDKNKRVLGRRIKNRENKRLEAIKGKNMCQKCGHISETTIQCFY